jgi:hypothetical protein
MDSSSIRMRQRSLSSVVQASSCSSKLQLVATTITIITTHMQCLAVLLLQAARLLAGV